VKCVFKILYIRKMMEMKLLHWKGEHGMRKWYETSDIVQRGVDGLLTKFFIHLHGDDFGSETWTKEVRGDMDHTETITLFAVKMQDGAPPDVRGFVMTDLTNPVYAYIEWLCAIVEKQGVGSFLLKNLVKILTEMQHRFVVVNFRSEISAFYHKCNFLPPYQVTLTEDELMDIERYRTFVHCELGVVILRPAPVAKKRRVMLASVADAQRQSASKDGSE
jgi:hypothetical protein